MASTIRQKAVVQRKKVVRPVLTNALTLDWPVLSPLAQAQIEASLRDVLLPLVLAREAQFRTQPAREAESSVQHDVPMQDDNVPSAPAGVQEEPMPVASTSALPAEDIKPVISKGALNPNWSKRAAKRAKSFERQERRDAHLPEKTHELHLRSGKEVLVPDHIAPEKFRPSLLLDKRTALDSRPAICDAILLGINVVARALESEIEESRRELAGLTPVAKQQTQQDSLRLFIPAPNTSTRRQRREMRNQLQPLGERKRRKLGHATSKEEETVMPLQLGNVRSGDPALQYVLEEADKEDGRKGNPYAKILEIVCADPDKGQASTEAAKVASAGETMQTDPTSTGSTALDGGVSTAKVVGVPTELVEAALTAGLATNATISMLISLLMRCDPNWFSVRNKVNARKVAAAENAEHASAPQDLESRLIMEAMSDTKAPAYVVGTDNAALEAYVAAKDAKKKAEKEAKAAKEAIKSEQPSHKRAKPVRLIFVAKEDINPLSIVQHILTSTAAKNSVNIARRRHFIATQVDETSEAGQVPGEGGFEDTYLVPLGKNAEARLAEILDVRRVAVLAFRQTDAPAFEGLVKLVKSHIREPLSASWLVPAVSDSTSASHQHVPTTIKHLETTVPVDPKAVRAEKKAKLKAKKEASKGGLAGVKRKA